MSKDDKNMISLRDYFAARAMQSLYSSKTRDYAIGWVVRKAYKVADEMLIARDECSEADAEEIEAATGLTKNRLWGLMKAPLQRMKVKRTKQGFWAIDKTYNEEIDRGVKYLRSIGYTVIPPKEKK